MLTLVRDCVQKHLVGKQKNRFKLLRVDLSVTTSSGRFFMLLFRPGVFWFFTLRGIEGLNASRPTLPIRNPHRALTPSYFTRTKAAFDSPKRQSLPRRKLPLPTILSKPMTSFWS